MAQRLTEIDWRPEVTVNIGPASIRLYPSNGADKVQSEWMALDAWVAVRGTLRSKPGEAPVNFNEKEKGAARSLFMINQIVWSDLEIDNDFNSIHCHCTTS